MNTVDALNALGKALLGDNYTPGVGRTDAETIDDIAKAVSENPIGGGGSGSGGGVIFIEHKTSSEGSWYEGTTIDPGLGAEDLLKYIWCIIMPVSGGDTWTPTPPAIPIQQSSEDTIEILVSVIEGEQNVEVPVFYHKDTGVIKSRVSD